MLLKLETKEHEEQIHAKCACMHALGEFKALVTWNFEHILRERTEWLLEIINREKNIHVARLRSPEVYIW